MKKAFILLAAFAISSAVVAASARQVEEREPAYKILGITEPSLLPDSGFYFFKEIGRGFRRFFTFDAVKKAELELKIADEKLAEFDKVLTGSEADEKILERTLENYLEAQKRLKSRLESLQGKNKNIDELLGKLADRVLAHGKLFKDREDDLKEGGVEKAEKEIAANAKKGIELDEKKFKEKLKEKIKEETDDLEDMDALEEIDDLFSDELDDELSDLAEEINEELEDKALQKSQCGTKPGTPGNWVCKEGKWSVIENQSKESEKIFCSQEYAPVCGADNKTYSNKCFASAAGVEVRRRGECEKSERKQPEKSAPTPTPNPLPAGEQKPKGELPTLEAMPAVTEFRIEADDYGFYPSNTLNVTGGAKVKIIFSVKTTGVYYGGLDFRSSKFATAAAKPGETATVEFTADEPFTITSYWPLSGAKKADMKVEVK